MTHYFMIDQIKDIPTPFYLYRMDRLEKSLSAISRALGDENFHVHYAVKANANLPILKKVKEAGLGSDCVSGGEIQRSIEAGFSPGKIVFAGVGKSDREIELALDHEIQTFNCESKMEVEVLADLATRKEKKANVALRIKPNVDARTHHYITTGLEENKFGMGLPEALEIVQFVSENPSLEFEGIHFHIGSQITELSVFRNLCLKINEVVSVFEEKGHTIHKINVGGGLGVDYHQPDSDEVDFKSYFSVFKDHLNYRKDQEVHFELGRAIVAHCGDLVSSVLYVKKGIKSNFLILDSGMTELIRPALYQSYHKIENWSRNGDAAVERYDVVGPICESSDYFGKSVNLPQSKRGDLIVVRSCGAYGEVMSSNYNLRDKVEAVYL